MFLFKPHLIACRFSHKIFLFNFLAVLTLIVTIVMHPSGIGYAALSQSPSVPLLAQEVAPATEPVAPSPATTEAPAPVDQAAPPVEQPAPLVSPIAPAETTTEAPAPPVDQAAPPVEQPNPLASPIASSETALLFQNDRYAVRVFRENGQAYLNVYDKTSQTQPLDKVPVSITPASDPKKDATVYVATLGDQQYTVTINPLGASELTIQQGGAVTYQQTADDLEIAQKIPGISDQNQPVNPTRQLVKTIFVNYAKLTLFILMFAMGIRWTFTDVKWLWTQPSLLVRSLFSVLVAVPILGIFIAFLPGLTVADRIGIGAMIICPGAPMIPLKSLKAQGNPKFIASLQFTVCILAIITVPLFSMILAQFFPNEAWLSPLTITQQIFFAQVLPMGLGVLIAQYLPKLAHDLTEPATKIASFLLLLVIIVLLTATLDDVLHAGFATYFALIFMGIASLACGHFLGGPDPDNQTVLAYATATRNAGLAVLLVTLNFPTLDYVKGGIIDILVSYALIAAFVAIPYTAKRKKALASRAAAQEASVQ